MRLGNILITRGLASSDQIQEALEYQQRYGGRLETHLYRFGYVDEAELVEALSQQFGYEGVTLSDVDIARDTLSLIPPALARNYLVIPFEHDPSDHTLKLACENPADGGLVDALGTALPDTEVKLHIALGIAVKCAIVKFYRDSLVLYQDEGQAYTDRDRSATAPYASGKASARIKEVVQSHGKACRVLILSDPSTDLQPLGKRLVDIGFQPCASRSLEEFLRLRRQSPPGIILLIKSGTVEQVSELVCELAENGVFIDQIPTFLLPLDLPVDELTSTLGAGIEDIIPFDSNLDLLIIKMDRVRNRLEAESSRRISVIQDLGTYGSLEDMNMLDLLQTLGPSRKTARISITGHGRHLAMYLDRGQIIHAECNGKTGAEAVFDGIAWTRGIWNIDPIDPDDLPEPNNHLPNESILLEGCRLLDELNRVGSPQ
jgi:hypothetical protein